MYIIISLHLTSGIILGSSVQVERLHGSTLSPVEVTLHSYRFLDAPVRLETYSDTFSMLRAFPYKWRIATVTADTPILRRPRSISITITSKNKSVNTCRGVARVCFSSITSLNILRYLIDTLTNHLCQCYPNYLCLDLCCQPATYPLTK